MTEESQREGTQDVGNRRTDDVANGERRAMASDGDDDNCKLCGQLASGGTQNRNSKYLFPLSSCCEESYHSLWDTSAFGNNSSVVNELIGSKLENEECADERRDAVCDHLAVDHVVLKRWACKLNRLVCREQQWERRRGRMFIACGFKVRTKKVAPAVEWR